MNKRIDSLGIKAHGEHGLGFCRLMVALAALMYGCESVTVKLAYNGGWTVFSLMAARFSVAILLFAAAVAIKGAPWLVERGYRCQALGLAILQLSAMILLYLAYATLDAALATLFFYAYPSTTALVSRLVFRTPLRRLDISALLVSAAGLVLLYWSSALDVSPLGVAYALLSAIFQGFRLNVAQRLMPKISVTTYNFNAVVMIAAVGWLICLAGGAGEFSFAAVSGLGWLCMLLVGVFVTGAATFLTMLYIPRVGAVSTSLIMLLEPPVTALLAFAVFGDRLTGWQLVGGALIIIAVVLPLWNQNETEDNIEIK